MSVNIFEIIVKKELVPVTKVFPAHPANNTFFDFVFSDTLLQNVPKGFISSGLNIIAPYTEGSIISSKGAFNAPFVVPADPNYSETYPNQQATELHPFLAHGREFSPILSDAEYTFKTSYKNFVYPSFTPFRDWEVRTFSVDNHGLSQDKTERLENTFDHGYPHYLGGNYGDYTTGTYWAMSLYQNDRRLIPKLRLNSRTSEALSSDLFSSINSTFDSQSITDWTLHTENNSTAVNLGSSASGLNYASITSNNSNGLISKTFSGSNSLSFNRIYKATFSGSSGSGNFRLKITHSASRSYSSMTLNEISSTSEYISSGSGSVYFYIPNERQFDENTCTFLFESENPNATCFIDSVELKEEYGTDRIGNYEDFKYVPDGSNSMSFAVKPSALRKATFGAVTGGSNLHSQGTGFDKFRGNERYSIDPLNMIDYGSYVSENILATDKISGSNFFVPRPYDVRRNYMSGTLGSANRGIIYEYSAVRPNNTDDYDPRLRSMWYYKEMLIGSKETSQQGVSGDVLAPPIIRVANVFSQRDIGKFVTAELKFVFNEESAVSSNHLFGTTYVVPHQETEAKWLFNNHSTTIGSELISDNDFLYGEASSASDGWYNPSGAWSFPPLTATLPKDNGLGALFSLSSVNSNTTHKLIRQVDTVHTGDYLLEVELNDDATIYSFFTDLNGNLDSEIVEITGSGAQPIYLTSSSTPRLLVITKREGSPSVSLTKINLKAMGVITPHNNPPLKANSETNPDRFFSQGSNSTFWDTSPSHLTFNPRTYEWKAYSESCTITSTAGSYDTSFKLESEYSSSSGYRIQANKRYNVSISITGFSGTENNSQLWFYDGSDYVKVFDASTQVLPANFPTHKILLDFYFVAKGNTEISLSMRSLNSGGYVKLDGVSVDEVMLGSDRFSLQQNSNLPFQALIKLGVAASYDSSFTMNERIASLKLKSAQAYSLYVRLVPFKLSNLYIKLFSVTNNKYITTYSVTGNGIGEYTIDFTTPVSDSPLQIVSLEVQANSNKSYANVQFDGMFLSENNNSHSKSLVGGGSGLTNSDSKVIITTSEFSEFNIAKRYLITTTNSNTNVATTRLSNYNYTSKNDTSTGGEGVSFRRVCNPYKTDDSEIISPAWNDDETEEFNPQSYMVKDAMGFYMLESEFTVNVQLKIGSKDLRIFVDPLSDELDISSKFKLSSIDFKTCENSFVTRAPDTQNTQNDYSGSEYAYEDFMGAIMFKHNESSGVKAPELVRKYKWHTGYAENNRLATISWDVRSITGSVVVDFDNDKGNSLVISNTGTGSQTINIDGDTLRLRALRDLELGTIGSEVLTNPSLTTTSGGWIFGSAWNTNNNIAYISLAQSSIPSPNNYFSVLGIKQENSLIVGKNYQVEVELTGWTSGDISIILGAGHTPTAGGVTIYSGNLNGVGTIQAFGVAQGTSILILASPYFIGTINSISAKEVTGHGTSNVEAVINSLDITLGNDDGINYKCDKVGDETTNNVNSPYNIKPFSSGLRVYSESNKSEALVNSSGVVKFSTNIDSTRNLSFVRVYLRIPFLGTNNVIKIKHNITSPNITTTETVNSSNWDGELNLFSYENTSTQKGEGFDKRFLDIEFYSDGNNPLNSVIESIEVYFQRSSSDSETIHLDLHEDFTLPINLTRKDFKNLDAISGDYSKTISVPATSNNKNAVEFTNELNSAISESQKEGFETIIKSGGVDVFQGLLFLSETNLDEDGASELLLNMRSGNSNWAEKLKNKRIKDLNSKDFEVDYSSILGFEPPNIGSFNKTSLVYISEDDQNMSLAGNEEIIFPLIDNGKIYENIDGHKSISWDNIKPAYRIMNVIESIFKDIGYSLDSNFLSSNNEWANEFEQSFSSYKQNLVGVASKIAKSEEQVKFSEIDLTYSATESFNESIRYNASYYGKEPSRYEALYTGNVDSNPFRPRLKSVFLNKNENNPDKAYFCDYAYLRFNRVGKDLNNAHSYVNLTGDIPSFFSVKSMWNGTATHPKTFGIGATSEKSTIKVAESGYYKINATIKMDIHFSFTANSITETKSDDAVTVWLCPNNITGEFPYLDDSSFGTEAFDITEDCSLRLPTTKSKAENFTARINRTQFLSSGIDYVVMVLNGNPRDYDSNFKGGYKRFTIHDANLNIKIAESPFPMKGKNSLIYGNQAVPKLNYSNILPDVSSLEFVSEVSKIFNLIWDVNEVTKTVSVEPFEDFYRFGGSRLSLNETSSLDFSYYNNLPSDGLDSFSVASSNGSITTPEVGDGVVFSVSSNPINNPRFRYIPSISTVKGNKYVVSFYYNTFRRFKIIVGSNANNFDSYNGSFIESSPTAGDISSQVGTHTFTFTAKGSQSFLSWMIKNGNQLGGEQYNSLEINDIKVVGLEGQHLDWTDKAVIKNSVEHSVIPSNLHFKMKEDSSDYIISKSSKSDIAFGDRLIQTGIKKDSDTKELELKIFSALKMDNSNFIVENESLELPKIWSKPKDFTEVTFFEDLPDPNNEHEHKLATYSSFKQVPNGKYVSYSLNWVYDYDEKRLKKQIVNSRQYLSVQSYSEYDELIPNLTFSNLIGKATDKNIYEDFHEPLVNMFSFRDKMIKADVSLSFSDLNDIDFRDLIHINGNIYIINKVKDFNFSGEPTEVELLLVTLTK